MKNTTSTLLTTAILTIVGFGCSKFAMPGKVDLFEGDNVVQAIAKMKDKVGAGPVNVISVEIHTNEMSMEIQSPKNPKDIDKYTFKNGSVTGPEPVQVMSIGSLNMTGDKYPTESIDNIGWANIPATAKQAIAASKIEGAHVDLISIDAQQPTNGNPELKEQYDKEREEKRKECFKQSNSGDCLFKLMSGSDHPLVLTWRIFVEGPRGRKDFWADKNGKLNEKGF